MDVDSWGRGSYSNQWGGSGSLGGVGSGLGNGHGNGFGHDDRDGKGPTFFIPSYLRGTRHADRLHTAHQARLSARLEARSTQSSNAGSLSTSSSSINLHKMVPSHRGMTHDIIEKAPIPVYEESDMVKELPSRWNNNDKYAGLEIMNAGLEVRYNGANKTHVDEAAAVRSDKPMPRECGIFYFEVTVLSKGKEKYVSLLAFPLRSLCD
jgi:hypothetical protein